VVTTPWHGKTALDSASIPTKGAKTGVNPTDKGETGSTRHLVSDRNEVSLSMISLQQTSTTRWSLKTCHAPNPLDQHRSQLLLKKAVDLRLQVGEAIHAG
jgi:hypothetical protein